CVRSFNYFVEQALEQTRGYFEGLCLDCIGGSRSADDDFEAPYWTQDKTREYSSACRVNHSQASWYYSFVGSKHLMGQRSELVRNGQWNVNELLEEPSYLSAERATTTTLNGQGDMPNQTWHKCSLSDQDSGSAAAASTYADTTNTVEQGAQVMNELALQEELQDTTSVTQHAANQDRPEDTEHPVLEVSDDSGNESEDEIRKFTDDDDSVEKMKRKSDGDEEPEERPESDQSSESEKHAESQPAERADEFPEQEVLFHHERLPKIDEVPELKGDFETGGVILPGLPSLDRVPIESSSFSEYADQNDNMSSPAGSVRSASGSSFVEPRIPDTSLTPLTPNMIESSERTQPKPGPHSPMIIDDLKTMDASTEQRVSPLFAVFGVHLV
ncbi:hypothetical protein LTS18_011992, partial [Coniosporium uncinatum]